MKLILGTHPLPTLNFFSVTLNPKLCLNHLNCAKNCMFIPTLDANIIRTMGHLLHLTTHIEY